MTHTSRTLLFLQKISRVGRIVSLFCVSLFLVLPVAQVHAQAMVTPTDAASCAAAGGKCAASSFAGCTGGGHASGNCGAPGGVGSIVDCCVPSVVTGLAPAPAAPGAAPGAAPDTTPACPPPASGLHLQLPCCITTGVCTLDDIVNTGGYFANFITGLSAAFFFAAFVYGGAMYLISFGESKRIEAGKKAMTGAAYGMAIVLFAWTLVNYLANSLVGK